MTLGELDEALARCSVESVRVGFLKSGVRALGVLRGTAAPHIRSVMGRGATLEEAVLDMLDAARRALGVSP